MAIHHHEGDLPGHVKFEGSVAIDTETLGLNPHRDRLCLVQLSGGDGNAHLVQMPRGPYHAPRLAALLADPKVLKLFHFGRFDIAVLELYLPLRQLGAQFHASTDGTAAAAQLFDLADLDHIALAASELIPALT